MINLITELVKAVGTLLGIVAKEQEPAPRIERTDSKLARALAERKFRQAAKNKDAN